MICLPLQPLSLSPTTISQLLPQGGLWPTSHSLNKSGMLPPELLPLLLAKHRRLLPQLTSHPPNFKSPPCCLLSKAFLRSSQLAYPHYHSGERKGTLLQYSCLEDPMDGGAWWAAVHGVAKSRTRLSVFTFTFHFHALGKEMETHSSVLAWRIPGMGEPGGLPPMGSHRVRHNSSDLAAAEAQLLS